jgi:hypothetical protein
MCTVTGFMSGLDPIFHSENFMLFTFEENTIEVVDIIHARYFVASANDQKRLHTSLSKII